MVRFPADLIRSIKRFCREQDAIFSRPEAIRRILADWLRKHGPLAK